jgi:hypothetical protein
MPFKPNAARRHIPRQQHQVTNWAEYDTALAEVQQRVCLMRGPDRQRPETDARETEEQRGFHGRNTESTEGTLGVFDTMTDQQITRVGREQ